MNIEYDECDKKRAALRRRILSIAFALAEADDASHVSELIAELKIVVKETHEIGRMAALLQSEQMKRANDKVCREHAQANLELKRAKAEQAKVQALAAKGETRRIVQQAVLSGMITPINETSTEREVNRQRRSHGGVIRIESGDGK